MAVLFTYFCSQMLLMTTGQFIIIVLFYSLTGWLIAWLIIKILFWPIKPIQIAGCKLQGIIPSLQKQFSGRAGELLQSEFMAYKGLEEKIADPKLIARLRPEIEVHIDLFLQEKIKTVFPIIAQFMGEKTINQFKTALLTEIDTLLPVLLKNYSHELKNEIRLNEIVSERINALSIDEMRRFFHSNAAKQISSFKMVSTFIGFVCGMLTILILFLFNT